MLVRVDVYRWRLEIREGARAAVNDMMGRQLNTENETRKGDVLDVLLDMASH